MSGLEKLSIEDLGVNFADLDCLINESGSSEAQGSSGFFGPSRPQLKSYKQWSGCDGKIYMPYNKNEKIGRISDFISAATLAAKEKERELDKNEF